MKYLCAALVVILAWGRGAGTSTDARAEETIDIGSKSFTESVILGEMLSHLVGAGGAAAVHHRQLGGTRVLWDALLTGEIDAYPEYTGTISHEILAGEGLIEEAEIRAALAASGVTMTRPLGFNNTYAVGMRADVAAARAIERISDLTAHPDLVFGFGNEFMDRADGWPSLRDRYGLPQTDVTGLDHDLAYRALDSGDIGALDVYTTDAEIAYYGLKVLDDDLGHFPTYNAVILYRDDLRDRAPAAADLFARLEGAIDAATMSGLNAQVKLDGAAESAVAANFLTTQLRISAAVETQSWLGDLWRNTIDHLILVGISLSAAIVLAIPLGVVAARLPRFGQIIISIVGIVQTIPSLAMFVFMIPLLGIGGPPAMMALFLYSLLPIVRNTHAGLGNIPNDIAESADALGLSPGARLRLVDLPMAGPSILAGIKTSAVINVGTATLGALIGAGGYGQPILTGIRLDDIPLILQGAVPAAVLALLVQGGFEGFERMVVPLGLRLSDSE